MSHPRADASLPLRKSNASFTPCLYAPAGARDRASIFFDITMVLQRENMQTSISPWVFFSPERSTLARVLRLVPHSVNYTVRFLRGHDFFLSIFHFFFLLFVRRASRGEMRCIFT